MKVSVVITAFNEEEKIEECLKSVSEIAKEIIVVDNSSTDQTLKIALKYTDKTFSQKNDTLNIDAQKNFGFQKASDGWILSLDADERITEELGKEILGLKEVEEINGYSLPRKNMIFGKWIENTGWYPDYHVRLFRKNKGRFSEGKVHEEIQLDGNIKELINPILHINYDSIQEFLQKMIFSYTITEASSKVKNGYKYSPSDFFKMPISEFMKRYFAQDGYKDGMHGLVLSTLMAFYHFIIFLRLWEANKYPETKNTAIILSSGKTMMKKELSYWIIHTKIKNEKNLLKKFGLKVRRKVFS